MTILSYLVQSRHSVDQTVFKVLPSGRFTIWNPDDETDEMKPIFGRITDNRELEVWLDDDGNWGSDPPH